jgi:uncharacterized protein (DUF1501 family)
MTENISRRRLLGTCAAVGAGVAASTISTRFAYADPGYTGDTLVLLSLRGGFDGLSAIAPIGDPDYYRARPSIGVPKNRVIAGDGTFGLHPAMAPLLPLWKDGRLAAVHAVGQPDPTRSHFAAMEVMGSGVAMDSIDSFKLAGATKRPLAAALRQMYADAPAVLAAPARAADRALAATATLPVASEGAYPATDLGAALRDVARLIKARAGLVTAAVDCGDWDMHESLGTAVKGQRMFDNLTGLSLALAAFAADLGDAMKNVTLVTVSEFGRRVSENGSHGADHGHGNAMLLLGGGVRGGKVYAKWPTVAPGALVDGDLAATSDYRSVIGEVLQKRCGLGSLSGVFPSVTPSSFGLVAAR